MPRKSSVFAISPSTSTGFPPCSQATGAEG